MTEAFRKPAVFSVDDPRLVVAEPEATPSPGVDAMTEAPADNLPAVVVARRRRMPWGTMFWSAMSGLAVMALGLAITHLIEDLAARSPWLGALGLALAVVAGVALLVVVLRELIGLARLATVEALRERALTIIASDDRDGGRALVADMLSLTKRIPRLARGRRRGRRWR